MSENLCLKQPFKKIFFVMKYEQSIIQKTFNLKQVS